MPDNAPASAIARARTPVAPAPMPQKRALIASAAAPAETTAAMRLCFTISEACSALGISRATLYLLFKRGELAPKRIMGRTVIAADDLRRFVARLPDAPVRVRSTDAD